MDSLQRFIDLHRPDIDPELFAMALAIRYIRELINHGGSDMRRTDFELTLHPEHLEAFLARAFEITWKDARLAQKWHKVQQVLPLTKEAWEKGQILSRVDLGRAKCDQENMEYFSMIDFAVDCYTEVSSFHVYPDHPALQDWAVKGYMVAWREHFLKDQEGEERKEVGYDDILL